MKDKWQPIATAPKDGTSILVAYRKTLSAQWCLGVASWATEFGHVSGWSGGLTDGRNAWLAHPPTLWKPIKPPKE